jgi:tRNA nucleotidyltransferase/poly(A) polymerase
MIIFINMSKKQNPKLKEGDRIVLIYMPGEDVDTGTKGKVKGIGQQPSFGSEFDYMYNMEWYDDDEKVISTLSLLPQSDTWMLDPEFSQKNLQEARFTDLDDLISHVEWVRLFKKSDLKYIVEYLELIRQLGVVNMFQSGQFLGQTKEYLTKYFELYRMQQDLDENHEELIEKILEMSEMVRNIMISAAITDLEQKNKEITPQSATNRVNRLATEVVKHFMGRL